MSQNNLYISVENKATAEIIKNKIQSRHPTCWMPALLLWERYYVFFGSHPFLA
jgi:hypothetical protein